MANWFSNLVSNLASNASKAGTNNQNSTNVSAVSNQPVKTVSTPKTTQTSAASNLKGLTSTSGTTSLGTGGLLGGTNTSTSTGSTGTKGTTSTTSNLNTKTYNSNGTVDYTNGKGSSVLDNYITSKGANSLTNQLGTTSTEKWNNTVSNLASQSSAANTPTSNNTSGTSGNYSSGSATDGGSTDYYNELLQAFLAQNEADRNAAIQAILDNLGTVKNTYKNQINQVMDEYQQYIDQNQVKKYRAKGVLRENQANRGQLDSGMGRQELLNMNLGYDKTDSDLVAARTKAINEIYTLIAQAENEANQNKASVNSTYNQAALNAQINSLS